MAKFDTLKNYTEFYNEVKQTKDPFQWMLEKQLELQRNLAAAQPRNVNPKNIQTLGEIYDWLRDNKQALDDEFREVVDALPGIDTPQKQRSGIWKKWKNNYDEIRSKTIDSLSEEERFNLIEEFTDMWHFIMNMMLVLNVTPEILFAMYCYKNKVNNTRYQNKY